MAEDRQDAATNENKGMNEKTGNDRPAPVQTEPGGEDEKKPEKIFSRPASGEMTIDFEKINELMSKRRAVKSEAGEKEAVPASKKLNQEEKDGQMSFSKIVLGDEKAVQEKAPKEAQKEKKTKEAPGNIRKIPEARSHTGRPVSVDKAAREGADSVVRDKVSQSQKQVKKQEPAKTPAAPKKTEKTPKKPKEEEISIEINLPPPPAETPKPLEKGELRYIPISELHPFHTYGAHPFHVVDDNAMEKLSKAIKEQGVLQNAVVRREPDGNGYEIISGHRRCRASELAGLTELPCNVRALTDLEAVEIMRDSNKHRPETLPSELAALLKVEVEAIKHQGSRPKNDKEAEALGKRSVEIVGAEHDMNYKKVMRYLRLNNLVPELIGRVDSKNMGFMPAVEISYIRPENQRLIAVSIEGEQASPSINQAKRLRELDKENKLNGDVIDGILSEEKKEDRGVIISTAELSKYFGKEVTPAKMKEQIMELLDEWKEKQPPERTAPVKKAEKEK